MAVSAERARLALLAAAGTHPVEHDDAPREPVRLTDLALFADGGADDSAANSTPTRQNMVSAASDKVVRERVRLARDDAHAGARALVDVDDELIDGAVSRLDDELRSLRAYLRDARASPELGSR